MCNWRKERVLEKERQKKKRKKEKQRKKVRKRNYVCIFVSERFITCQYYFLFSVISAEV